MQFTTNNYSNLYINEIFFGINAVFCFCIKCFKFSSAVFNWLCKLQQDTTSSIFLIRNLFF